MKDTTSKYIIIVNSYTVHLNILHGGWFAYVTCMVNLPRTTGENSITSTQKNKITRFLFRLVDRYCLVGSFVFIA